MGASTLNVFSNFMVVLRSRTGLRQRRRARPPSSRPAPFHAVQRRLSGGRDGSARSGGATRPPQRGALALWHWWWRRPGDRSPKAPTTCRRLPRGPTRTRVAGTIGHMPRISYFPVDEVADDDIRGYLDPARRYGTPRPESQAIRAHVPAVIR